MSQVVNSTSVDVSAESMCHTRQNKATNTTNQPATHNKRHAAPTGILGHENGVVDVGR